MPTPKWAGKIWDLIKGNRRDKVGPISPPTGRRLDGRKVAYDMKNRPEKKRVYVLAGDSRQFFHSYGNRPGYTYIFDVQVLLDVHNAEIVRTGTWWQRKDLSGIEAQIKRIEAESKGIPARE